MSSGCSSGGCRFFFFVDVDAVAMAFVAVIGSFAGIWLLFPLLSLL